VSRHTATLRPLSFAGALLSLVPLALPIAALWIAGQRYEVSLLGGAALFLAYRIFVVRLVFMRDHHAGIVAMKTGRFADGLAAFERSEAVWRGRRALDRFRAVILGNASPFEVVTLARYNQAYALTRLGRGEEALSRLDALLADEPDMHLATQLREILVAGAKIGLVASTARADANTG
jgi:hypothetical protein